MDIILKGVSYIYPGEEKKALRNINTVFRAGTITAVVGRSGSGKSTLLSLLNGIRKPSEGTVECDKRRVALVFQYPENQLFEETVIKDVEFGPKNLSRNREERRRDAEEALRKVAIGEEKWNLPPSALSGGEKRRAALAGVLAMNRDALVLDEISSGLDGEGKRIVFDILMRLRDEGKTIVFTTHDPEEAALYAERTILLEKGEIKSDGKIDDAALLDESFMTEGLRLRAMLKKDGIEVDGAMSSLRDSIETLSSLLERG